MARYLKQKDYETTCGPLSIINAGKWAGNVLSKRKDFNRIIDSTGCDQNGAKISSIDRTLRKELSTKAIIWKPRNPNFLLLKHNIIHRAASAIVSYDIPTAKDKALNDSHVIFLSKIVDHFWQVHNLDRKATILMPDSDIERLMFPTPFSSIVAWLLFKI